MTPTADFLVDRRRMRRKLFFWRALAFLVAIVAIIGIGARFTEGSNVGLAGPHIARIAISGFISGDEDTLKLLNDVGNSRAAAVLLDINSPGGTTTGAELLHDGIRRLAAKKPVVAVVGTMAASGAYIAALGADEIVAHGNSIVGSIGVLYQNPNVSKLLDEIGVKVETIKSSPLKAAPSPLEPTSDAAREAMAALVADSYAWFKGLVKDRRKLTDEELAKVDDGRVFTGRQGLPLKLVDTIGGEKDAIAWLEQQKGIAKGLSVRDWKPGGTLARLGIFSLAAGVAQVIGLEGLAHGLDHAGATLDAATLDGLLAVWQAQPGR